MLPLQLQLEAMIAFQDSTWQYEAFQQPMPSTSQRLPLANVHQPALTIALPPANAYHLRFTLTLPASYRFQASYIRTGSPPSLRLP